MEFDPVLAAEAILRETSMALVPLKKNAEKQQEQPTGRRKNMLGVVIAIDRGSLIVVIKNSMTGKSMQHRATEDALDAMLRGVRDGAVQEIMLDGDVVIGFRP